MPAARSGIVHRLHAKRATYARHTMSCLDAMHTMLSMQAL